MAQAHSPPDNNQEQADLVADDRNALSVRCSTCGCMILAAKAAEYVTQKPFQLPLCRQKKNMTTVEKETLTEWWSVKGAFDFENIGFTNASDGVKYLVCADCEVGPVGFLCPETHTHFVALSRVKNR
uniref:Guanine nucleotide exchange factor MSS4 n=1 Tax=Parascaris univalens TaxID=6257 RepID=A0A914ZPD2_PARUN